MVIHKIQQTWRNFYGCIIIIYTTKLTEYKEPIKWQSSPIITERCTFSNNNRYLVYTDLYLILFFCYFSRLK
jgi:hypothetical protein